MRGICIIGSGQIRPLPDTLYTHCSYLLGKVCSTFYIESRVYNTRSYFYKSIARGERTGKSALEEILIQLDAHILGHDLHLFLDIVFHSAAPSE